MPGVGGGGGSIYEVACSANHVGDDIESGHYTATCRHPVNGVRVF